MKPRYGSKNWKETEIASQVKWIRERGDTIDGYIDRYGSLTNAQHYGNGGELIYVADMVALRNLDKDAPMNYFGIESEKLKKGETLMLEMLAGGATDWRLQSIVDLFGHSKPAEAETSPLVDVDNHECEPDEAFSNICKHCDEPIAPRRLLANEHYPIIAGDDRYGPHLYFGCFRSAMPSREVADTIVKVLAESDVYPTPGDITAQMQRDYSIAGHTTDTDEPVTLSATGTFEPVPRMSNVDMIKILEGAISGLRHGRYATAVKKVAQVNDELNRKETTS